MDDEAAFMQLVLANAQGELSPLERGMHALAATEEGRHGKSVRAYAKEAGRPEQSVSQEVRAAKVANTSRNCGNFAALVDRTRHLCEIHAAPAACWPTLTARLVAQKWTIEQTISAVRAVNSVKPPRGYESLFAIERLQEIAARGDDPAEVTKPLVRAYERGRADIRDGGIHCRPPPAIR